VSEGLNQLSADSIELGLPTLSAIPSQSCF
jgi:hypothetical protein